MNQPSIDPQHIKLITNRFKRLSLSRLDKMLSSYNLTQSDSIRLLPLLFHVNYPILPGYVDKQTPCGIPNYFPSELEKKIAKSIKRAFAFQTQAYLKFEIAALFLMGSTGTLGQSVHSDLDLWVCMSEKLSVEGEAKLSQKMKLISEWMAPRGIELNCYLVHQDDFTQKISKSLTKESCGDTQNFLLLDEFYRTAIWMVGKTPLWWLTPPGEFHRPFAERLLAQRHIDSFDWIDFGEVDEVPADEYFSAALWQMFKAIDSPYKSSMKLLLLEIYARYFPQSGLLSSQYKTLIYKGAEEVERLDPYLMILLCAEDFLANQTQRLEFLRRAFYLKTGAKIQLNKHYKKNWRHHQIQQLVRRWQWTQSRLDYLNDRPNWRINAVLKERDDLVRELTHSYHFLVNFARVQGVKDTASQKELLSLGRKLYVEFERRAGKIERVNNGIASDVSESSITLYSQQSGKKLNDWHLVLGAVNRDQLNNHKPVFKSLQLFEVLSWACCNQVIDANTNCHLYTDDSDYNRDFAAQIIKNILPFCRYSAREFEHDALQRPMRVTKIAVYINSVANSERWAILSNAFSCPINSNENVDYFCWNAKQINLLEQFYLLTLNSWGEYVGKHYEDAFGWIQLYIAYGDAIENKLCELIVWGAHSSALTKIKQRIEGLFSQWHRLKQASVSNPIQYRYLMSMANGFIRIDFARGEINYDYFSSTDELLFSLCDFSELSVVHRLDENLNLPVKLKQILKNQRQSNLNIFILQSESQIFEAVVTLPSGQIYYQRHRGARLHNLINHYQLFFDSTDFRLVGETIASNDCQYWYLDLVSGSKQAQFNRLDPGDQLIAEQFSKVQAIATLQSERKIQFDLYLSGQSFLYADYSELVYRKIVQQIISERAGGQRYPIFLSDLDLSALASQASLAEYLLHKRNIELKLAQAMAQFN